MKEKIEEKFGENLDSSNNNVNNLNKEYDESKVVNVNNLIKKKKKNNEEENNVSSINYKNIIDSKLTTSTQNNSIEINHNNEIPLKEEELSQNSKKENIDNMNLSHHKAFKSKSTSKKHRTDEDIIIEDN